MVWIYLVWAFIGGTLGFITGLAPGVHINLVCVLFVSGMGLILKWMSPIEAAIVLFAMAVTHNLADNITTTFLGVTSGEDLTGTVPAQRLLMKGRGFDVIRYAILGNMAGIGGILVAAPFLFLFIAQMYKTITVFIPYILIGVLVILIWKEKDRTNAVLVVVLAGIMGIMVFALPNLKQPLLPMLSGFFGLSAMVLGWKEEYILPEQSMKKEFEVKSVKIGRSAARALGASVATCFLPGLSASHTSLLAIVGLRETKDEQIIFIGNFCNMISIFLSLIALVTIEKARSGVVVALENFITLDQKSVFILILTAVITFGYGITVCLKLNQLITRWIARINYQKICAGVSLFLMGLTFLVCGWIGLVVLAGCCALGLFTHFVSVGKNNLMACIIIPVILYSFL